jgi:hypothetical protein
LNSDSNSKGQKNFFELEFKNCVQIKTKLIINKIDEIGKKNISFNIVYYCGTGKEKKQKGPLYHKKWLFK